MTTNGIILQIDPSCGPARWRSWTWRASRFWMQTTGKPIEQSEFNSRLAAAITLNVPRDGRLDRGTWMQRDLSLASPWQATQDTLWYYWNRYGRLVGYDVATRRCIGSLGPKGFAADLVGGGDRFSNAERPYRQPGSQHRHGLVPGGPREAHDPARCSPPRLTIPSSPTKMSPGGTSAGSARWSLPSAWLSY